MAGTASNDFYTRTTDFVRLTRAKGPEVQGEFDAVQVGFDNVESEADKKVEAPDAAAGWALPSATGNAGKLLQMPASGKTIDAVAVSALDAALVLDEDDFVSNSDSDAPSQQSVLSYLANSFLLDEDDLSSDSPTNAPSQQSVKAYVDALSVSPTVLHKSANYTITADDVDAPICVVAVDASGGSVFNIQLPTVGDLQNKLLKVFLDTDPGTATVTVNESDGATEIWTGVAKADYFEVTSDGTNYEVVSHYESHYVRVKMNSNESIAQGASEQIVNTQQVTDIGNIWISVGDDELTFPFDCYFDLHWSIITTDSNYACIAEAKLDTTYLRHGAVAVNAGGKDTMAAPALSGRFEASANQALQLWVTNIDSDSGNAVIAGDGAGDESFATVKLTRKY